MRLRVADSMGALLVWQHMMGWIRVMMMMVIIGMIEVKVNLLSRNLY